MTYIVIMVFVAIALVFFIFLLFFMQMRSAKSKNSFSSTATLKGTTASILTNDALSSQASSTKLVNQQRLVDRSSSGGLTYGQVTRMPESARLVEPMQEAPTHNLPQSYPGPVAYHRAQQEFSPHLSSPSFPPLKPAHAQTRYELEQEYERGMRTIYDEQVGAVNFIGIHVIMNTPAEVELAFHVCKRQIRSVLQSRGLDRAPTLTDMSGIVVGKDATAVWGQALKEYLEEMCIKVGKDTYLIAHYNSRADRPGQDQLREKIMRIQLMTSAAINNFQSNIFDTREEAAAFLQRMREIYRV
jgi:hypothetical protein